MLTGIERNCPASSIVVQPPHDGGREWAVVVELCFLLGKPLRQARIQARTGRHIGIHHAILLTIIATLFIVYSKSLLLFVRA
jgi:hypothetical protein